MNRMKSKGFTLVELILSLAIFSLLLGSFFYVFEVELGCWKRMVASAEKQQVASVVLSRITRDARAAREFLPGSDQNRLRLKIGSETIEYGLLEQKVRRKKNQHSAYLTSPGEIGALSFSYPQEKLLEIKVDNFATRIALRN